MPGVNREVFDYELVKELFSYIGSLSPVGLNVGLSRSGYPSSLQNIPCYNNAFAC